MTFILSDDQLLDIAGCMAREIRTGLATDGADILGIPTFIPLARPPGPGTVLAIDVGGTNARCAVISLDADNRLTVDKGPVRHKIPTTRGAPIDQAAFLDCLAQIIQELNPPRGLPVGYCFSYPARPTPDGDAVILRWTKELFVNDTIGQKAGQMLRDRLNATNPGLMGKPISVINDTVAALLAGMTASKADAYIGLIVGTGTNMAMIFPPAHIPKLTENSHWQTALPVNLESGNFHPPHLNPWDEALDASSHNPSRQRFEKAVSGFYLPYLFKLACPRSDVNPESGSAALFHKAYSTESSDKGNIPTAEAAIARQIIERSAKLTAASLAGVITVLVETTRAASVSITAEGGLFQAHRRYKETMETTLKSLLLRRPGLNNTKATIQTVANANLMGCAIAGLKIYSG